MVRPEPIPADLWHRLARLDARCDISMERRDANRPGHRHTSGRNYDREWVVKIQEKGCLHRGPMTVEGGCALQQVLEAGIDKRVYAHGCGTRTRPNCGPRGWTWGSSPSSSGIGAC